MIPPQIQKLLNRKIGGLELLLFLSCLYGCFAVYVFFRADSLIFQPPPATYQNTADILRLPVNSQEQIAALYLPNTQATYTLLYIHGNAEDLGGLRPELEKLRNWGFSIFAYDYRGYGTSNGSPNEQNAYQDAEIAYEYLNQQLHVPANQIIVYGRSLGGGSAVELATRKLIAGLILQSTFISAFRVVVPFPILPFEKFHNHQKIPKIRCPLLVMHGQADRVIPLWHGQELFDIAPEPKLSLWVEGAGHNDFVEIADESQRQIMKSFQELIQQRK